MSHSILALLFLGTIGVVCIEGQGTKGDMNAIFDKRIRQIRESRKTKEFGVLERIYQESKKDMDQSSWGYNKIILEICISLSSVDYMDRKQLIFLHSLSLEAANAPKKAPIELIASTVRHLQIDFDYRVIGLRNDEWEKSRRAKTKICLSVLQRIDKEIDRAFDFKDFPFLNMAPPGGKYDSGIDPSQIVEPEIRKAYQKALESNAEKATRYSYQRTVQDLEKGFFRDLEYNVVRAYSIEPMNIQEVKADFKEYGIPQELTNRVVEKLEARALALSNRPPPPKMQFKEPPDPPGPGPHHADLRLRKRVSFELTRPKVEAVLQKLTESTGVNLARADGIQNQYWATGSISYTGVPAWQVMDDLAAYKRVEGRWEADGAGYRLERNGNPVVIPEAPAPWYTWRNILIGVGAFLAATAIGVLAFLWRRAKNAAAKPSKA